MGYPGAAITDTSWQLVPRFSRLAMAIPITCPGCGKNFKAENHLAGRTVSCPNCQHPFSIPLLDESEPGETYGVKEPEAPPPLPEMYLGPKKRMRLERDAPLPVAQALPGNERREEPPAPRAKPAAPERPTLPVAKLLPAAEVEATGIDVSTIDIPQTPAWLRHLHWVLALALIPLVISLLHKDEGRDDIKERFEQTISQLPEERQQQARQKWDEVEKGEASEDELFEMLPRKRLVGAFLPRSTIVH